MNGAETSSSLLTPRWTALRPHGEQQRYFTTPHRFNTLAAGRRSGKTELAKRKVVLAAMMGKPEFPDSRFFCAGPTRDQAKRIFWNDLKLLVPVRFMKQRPSETELKIELINGSEIVVIGLDKPERMEGVPWDGGVITEFANVRPGAWGENIRPALSDRSGWCDLEGVPEGRNHYYRRDRDARRRMLKDGVESPWGAFHWRSEEILSPEEIAQAKEDLDEMTYEQEYGASFLNFEGRAYYPFTDTLHCRRLEYRPTDPLIFMFDFNVAPGVAAIGQEMILPGQFDSEGLPQIGTGIIGEVYIEHNSNTPAVCRKLIQDWGDHQGLVRCYGDATGGNKGSAKVQGSDWDLIRMELAGTFANRISYLHSRQNPPERARINAVNSRLLSTAGDVRLMVDPAKAPHVVMDFEGVQLLKGGSGEIDKGKHRDDGLTHISDAIGYYVEEKYPVREGKTETFELTF